MQYLTHWRMQLESNLLRTTVANVASIAVDVGYDSEAAFARAFKRAVGMPPAAWRPADGVARRSSLDEGADASLHGDDYLSPSVAPFDMTEGRRGLAQRVRAVDDRRELSGFDEFLQIYQVVMIRHRKVPAQALAHER